MSTDKKLSKLIINKLTQEKFDAITPSVDELYLVEETSNYATVEELATKQDIITDLGDIRNNIATNTSNITYLDEKVRDIELFKFPNAIIRGEPTIQNGQVSNFSTVSYLQFPFILDLHNQAFQIDFCFTTATNVTTQQNILDSNFGLALAIQNGRGVMAISSNGTNWDIGSAIGSVPIESNTTYYARLSWNRLQYKTQLSTDGVNYTDDMVIVNTKSPFPRTMFIGGCDQIETGHTPHPFLGTINMNKAYLSVMGQVIWQGMDDAGLSTRADLSLSNLDSQGLAMFDNGNNAYNTIQTYGNIVTHNIDEFLASSTTISDLTTQEQLNALNSSITSTKVTNYDTHIANGTIHVTAGDKIAWSNKQDKINNLSTIESYAQAGKSASDTIANYGNIVTHNSDEFQVAGDYATTTQLTQGLDTKQDTITDLDTIRDGASKGSTAIQNTNDCVHLTGDETINGKKSFNSTATFNYHLQSNFTSSFHDATYNGTVDFTNATVNGLNFVTPETLDNYVLKSGDTITGDLLVEGQLNTKAMDIDVDVAPETQQWYGREIQDKNGKRIGILQVTMLPDKTLGCDINVGREVNGTPKYSVVQALIDVNGNASCRFPNTKCVDGQWVAKSLTVSEVKTAATRTVNLKTNGYLPNDSYKYEVMCSIHTNNHNSTASSIFIHSDVLTHHARIGVSSSNGFYSAWRGVLPVNTTLTWEIANAISETFLFTVNGYRRIGTNG